MTIFNPNFMQIVNHRVTNMLGLDSLLMLLPTARSGITSPPGGFRQVCRTNDRLKDKKIKEGGCCFYV